VNNVSKRLRQLRADPWKDYWTCRQRLNSALIKHAGSL